MHFAVQSVHVLSFITRICFHRILMCKLNQNPKKVMNPLSIISHAEYKYLVCLAKAL